MEIIIFNTLKETLIYLQRNPGTKIIAGGTDFIIACKDNKPAPDMAVSIKSLPELRTISSTAGAVVIGAGITHTELLESKFISRSLPLLFAAAASVGCLQIRNSGTIGGNLGTASPAGDLLPALIALRAEVRLQSARGERQVFVKNFLTGPGKTLRTPEELITGIIVPEMDSSERYFFRKLGQRQAMSIAIASVAGRYRITGRVVTEINVACGSVAPTAVELLETARRLTGYSLDNENLLETLEVCETEISPISDLRASAEYRRRVIKGLIFEGLLLSSGISGQHKLRIIIR